MFNIALICTCFNRVELTKKSLNSITKNLNNTKKVNKFHFFVLDDNSTDETNEFLSNHKFTSVLKSEGNLYWAGGMRKCFEYFYKEIVKYDVLIVFNDDIDIKKNNLDDLFEKYNNLNNIEEKFLLSVPSYYNNKITYGGKKFKFNSLIPIFETVVPISNKILKVDVLNMNFVLIPIKIIQEFKFFDRYFRHALADIAYCLKLKKFNINSYLYDEAIISCKPNLTERNKLENIDREANKQFYKEYFKLYYYLAPIRLIIKKFLLWIK